MDTSPLNVFHDARKKDIVTVADSINFTFATLQVGINEDRCSAVTVAFCWR